MTVPLRPPVTDPLCCAFNGSASIKTANRATIDIDMALVQLRGILEGAERDSFDWDWTAGIELLRRCNGTEKLLTINLSIHLICCTSSARVKPELPVTLREQLRPECIDLESKNRHARFNDRRTEFIKLRVPQDTKLHGWGQSDRRGEKMGY